MEKQVTFLGLGVMGFPMAGRLQNNGLDTCGWNRTLAKQQQWQKLYNGRVADSLAAAVKSAAVVCMCLGNDDDVRSVVYGKDGVLANMQEGSLLVDHTTTSANLARELGLEAAKHNIAFVDAPVSGGQLGAESGQLTIMAGGEKAAFVAAEGIFSAYAKKSTLIGKTGSGQLAKMVNQICITGILQGLSEALVFAGANKLDTARVIEAIGEGAAQSWQMNNRALAMLGDEFEFGFAVDWMIKDITYCLAQAAEVGVNLPVAAKTLNQYKELSQAGCGKLDTSSLVKSVAAQQQC